MGDTYLFRCLYTRKVVNSNYLQRQINQLVFRHVIELEGGEHQSADAVLAGPRCASQSAAERADAAPREIRRSASAGQQHRDRGWKEESQESPVDVLLPRGAAHLQHEGDVWVVHAARADVRAGEYRTTRFPAAHNNNDTTKIKLQAVKNMLNHTETVCTTQTLSTST